MYNYSSLDASWQAEHNSDNNNIMTSLIHKVLPKKETFHRKNNHLDAEPLPLC